MAAAFIASSSIISLFWLYCECLGLGGFLMRLLFAGIIEPGCFTAYPEMIVLGPDARLLVTTLEPAAASLWEFMAERPAPDDAVGFACTRLLLLDGLIERP